jgi:multidrug transporter EmrE-like cation transporter
MSAVAVALVMGSALLHAWWNARAHAGDDRVAELTVAYATGALLLAPWILADPPSEVLALVVVSGCVHAGYLTLLASAYQRGSLAIAYPIARGSAPLLVTVAAVWVLDQEATVPLLVGAALLGTGLVLVGGVAWGTGERGALAFALATGAMIASYSLLDARGVDETGALGWFSAVSAVSVVIMIAGHRQSLERLRAAARAGASVGLAQSVGYALVLLAFARADAGRVATLRGTSILFGLLLARRAVDSRIVAGALLVVGGAGLVVA